MMEARSVVRGGSVLAALACAIAMAWVLPTTAAAEQQLQVSPTKSMLQTTAGSTVSANITITAPDSGIAVNYEHQDFGFDKHYQVVLIPDDDPKTTSFSTRNWFTLATPTFLLKRHATRTIPIQIKVPKNTPSGTYMGAAIFAVTPTGDARGGQIQANVSVATLIFISVAGGDPPQAKIRRFDVPRLVTRGTFTPDLIVDNTGTLGFTADGDLRVDKKQPEVDQSYAPQYVQPHKPRTLHVQGSKTQTARVDTRTLGMGRHTVTLRLRIDPTNATLVIHRTFWVIPMWIRILAGIVLLLLILGCSWIGVRLRQKFVARRAEELALVPLAPNDETNEPEASPDPADVDDDHEASYDEQSYDEESSAYESADLDDSSEER